MTTIKIIMKIELMKKNEKDDDDDDDNDDDDENGMVVAIIIRALVSILLEVFKKMEKF